MRLGAGRRIGHALAGRQSQHAFEIADRARNVVGRQSRQSQRQQHLARPSVEPARLGQQGKRFLVPAAKTECAGHRGQRAGPGAALGDQRFDQRRGAFGRAHVDQAACQCRRKPWWSPATDPCRGHSLGMVERGLLRAGGHQRFHLFQQIVR